MTLLPPNATPLERNLASLTERLDRLPVPLRDLWNPDTCPANLLPWLAWAFGLSAWKEYWPEKTKRDLIKQAVILARRKGTRYSVEQVVKSFGANLVLREWWETTPPGTPHTFDIVINYGGDTVTEALQNDVVDEIRRVKPARSHFTLSIGLSATAAINLVGVVRVATYNRLTLTG